MLEALLEKQRFTSVEMDFQRRWTRVFETNVVVKGEFLRRYWHKHDVVYHVFYDGGCDTTDVESIKHDVYHVSTDVDTLLLIYLY